MANLKHLFWALLLTTMVFFYAETVIADSYNLIPSVALEQSYNDNVFFDDEEIDDFITTVSPALELVKKTERINAGLSGKADWIRYDDNSEINATDQHYTGHVNWQANPRLSLFSSAGYTRDSRTDREIEETGLLLGTSTRDRYHFTLSGNYSLTEETGTALSYSHNQENFENPRSNDTQSHNVNIGFTHNLSELIPLTTGRLNIGYNRNKSTNDTVVVSPFTLGNVQYDYVNTTDTDHYTITIGASSQLSEVLTVVLNIGSSYTHRENTRQARASYSLLPSLNTNLPTETETTKNWGSVGGAELAYNGEYNSGNISLSHDMKPGSGRNGLTERTSMRISINRRFTDKLRGSLAFSYHFNRTDQGQLSTQDIDQESLNIHPLIRYNCTKDITLEASYTYAATMNKVEGTESHRNLYFFRLKIQHPLFE